MAPLAAGGALALAYPPAPPRNAITDKLDESTARVGASDYDIAVGEAVRVFRQYCYRGRRGAPADCFDYPVGDGTVVALVAPHALDVRFQEGSEFDRGDRVVPARLADAR